MRYLQLDRDIDLSLSRGEHLRGLHPPVTQRVEVTATAALLDFPGIRSLARTGFLTCHSSMIQQHSVNPVQRHTLLPKHL